MLRSILRSLPRFAAIFTALAAPLILGQSAKAALSETFTTSTPISVTAVSYTKTLAFQQFDPSLGTLTGASFSISIPASGSATLSNSSASTVSFGGSITDPLALKDPLSNTLDSTSGEVDFFYTVPPGNGTYQTGTVTGTDVSAFSLNAAERAEFTGTGLINISATAGAGSVTANSPVTGTVTSFGVGLTGTVTYSYTAPVPEPTSLSLLGIGTVGLLRRRSRRAAGI